MYIEDARKIEFKKKIGDGYISFSIEKPVTLSFNKYIICYNSCS